MEGELVLPSQTQHQPPVSMSGHMTGEVHLLLGTMSLEEGPLCDLYCLMSAGPPQLGTAYSAGAAEVENALPPFSDDRQHARSLRSCE